MDILNSMAQAIKEKERDWHEVDGRRVCNECGGYRDSYHEWNGRTMLLPTMCNCQIEKQRQEDMKQEAKEQEKALKAKLLNCFQGRAYSESTFEVSDNKDSLGFRACRKYAEGFPRDFGLILWGEPAGGKTFYAACIANELISQGFNVAFRSMPMLVQGGLKLDVDDLLAYDLLIIDDFGAERATDFGAEIVYTIVNERYESNKPTVYTTNLTLQELSQPEDLRQRRTFRRILDTCYPIEVKGTHQKKISYDQMKKELGL